MNKSKFGPESTNPRQQRAYAHALRDKALSSGEPQDKLAAVEAAMSASTTTKGKDLGKQALSAFRRAAGQELHVPYPIPRPRPTAKFYNKTSAQAMKLVSEIDGEALGLTATVTKPESIEDYTDATRQVDADRVRNLKGMSMYGIIGSDGKSPVIPADTPSTEQEIQDIAASAMGQDMYVVKTVAKQGNGNFHRTVEAITQPHTHVQQQ